MNNLVDVSLVPALHEHVLILPAGEKEVGAVRPVGVHGGVPPDAADAPRAAHAAGAAHAAHVVHAATVVELALAHGVLAGPGLAPAAAAALWKRKEGKKPEGESSINLAWARGGG